MQNEKEKTPVALTTEVSETTNPPELRKDTSMSIIAGKIAPVDSKELVMSSREIAELTNKRHPDVKRDIKTMLDQLKIGVSNFAHTYQDVQNKQQTEFLLPKIYIECLLMGYSAELRMRVLTRLHELEEQSKFLIPQTLPDALRLAADLADQNKSLQREVEEIKPQAQIAQRISLSDGSMCISNAAKNLQIQPKRLFEFMSHNRWIFRRAGGKGWNAYQDKIQSGLLEHKSTTISLSDGTERISEQVLVKPKGMTKLAALLNAELEVMA